MKVHLLYRNRDFDFQAPLPWSAEALIKDLELGTLFGAMAQDDEFLFEAIRQVFLTGFETQIGTIRYRQEILQDCLKQPRAVRELYALAGEAMELSKKQYIGFLVHNPDAVLWGAIDHMKTFLGVIRKLRGFADSHAGSFDSEGWNAFFSRLQQELDDEYLAGIERHLGVLRFRHQLVLSAELGAGNKGDRYLLHRPGSHRGTWLERLILWLKTFFGWRNSPGAYGFSLHPNDESGARALSELRNRAISDAARTLAQARDNVRDFFTALQKELAFYVGCLNLQKQLDDMGEPLCFPVPEAFAPRRLSFRGLYDVCLSLRMKRRVVGNDAGADGKDLV
ncbi:MAG TPA: hypothetical protein VJ955_08235, partial [Desulfuromonadales bacterium]|nr:hypothetical protein [Desulfuromonadales bacterium]